MINIGYPNLPFRIQKEKEKEMIFDENRKKWVRLTPEEWVRQNFIQYLVQILQYPATLLAVEKEIKLGELKKRCDIIVYKQEKPWMIVECKEPGVELDDRTALQIFAYNMVLKAEFLVLVNGKNTFCLHTPSQKMLETLPDYHSPIF
jgi:hypothetical protein